MRASILHLPEPVAAAPQTAAALRPGLLLLLQAWRWAAECRRDPWEFAVSVSELKAAGLNHAHLRWLVCHGYVEHARERTLSQEKQRSFVKPANIAISRRSCFLLTAPGQAFASHLDQRAAPVAGSRALPRWDRRRRELWVNDSLVKRFRVPAVNQLAVLDALEEEGWPARLDDPLPPALHGSAKARLHDTIKALNRNQVCALIRFFGDGTGQAIMWALCRQPTEPD